MFNAIFLENFQGFKEPQRIEFAPITLIFGSNASGKSSFARAMKLMQQSDERSNFSQLRGFVFNGSQIDLNSFASTVHGQFRRGENTETIGIGVNIAVSNQNSRILSSPMQGFEYTIRDTRDRESEKAQKVAIEYKVYFETEENGSRVAHCLVLEFGAKDNSLRFGGTPKHRKDAELIAEKFFEATTHVTLDGEEFEDTPYTERPDFESSWSDLLKKSIARNWIGNSILMRLPLGEELSDAEKQRFHLLSEIMHRIRLGLYGQFANTTYIEPIRKIPGRVELAGEGHRLLKGNLKVLNHWVGELTDSRYSIGIDEFEVPQSPHKVLTNFVRDNWTEAVVSFDEVGTGLSQILPVLSAIFPLRENAIGKFQAKRSRISQTVFIEQPEIHLHPRAQSDLADAFISAIQNEETHLQIIAETHSENLLLRLQKRIREGLIPASSVAVIFTEGDRDARFPGNRAKNIHMSEEGDVLDPFPVSFADVRIQDLL